MLLNKYKKNTNNNLNNEDLIKNGRNEIKILVKLNEKEEKFLNYIIFMKIIMIFGFLLKREEKV